MWIRRISFVVDLNFERIGWLYHNIIFGVNMSKLFIIVFPILGVAFGHDTYTGTCPKFQGMVGFNWNRVYIIFIVKLPSEIYE